MSGPPRPAEAGWLRDVFLCLGLFALGLVGQRWLRGEPLGSISELGILLTFALAAWVTHRSLVGARVRGDQRVLPLVVLLSGLGLLMNLRLAGAAEPHNLLRWLVLPLACLTLLAAYALTRRWLRGDGRWGWLAGLAALALLWGVLMLGRSFRGAVFGPGLTTPTELLKPLLVVFLAWYLGAAGGGRWRDLLFVAVGLGLVAGLVRQSDLGMIMILGGLAVSLLFVHTGRPGWLLAGLGLAVVAVLTLSLAGSALLPAAAQKTAERVQAWLNPWQDPVGLGYQSLQAMFAMHAGGLDGAGLGAGQVQLVPLVRSDFVWAALAEDLGLLGCGLVLLAYWALFVRGALAARRGPTPFAQGLAVGCVTVLVVQTLLNLGGVVRLVPVTGITLPFISQGGSSLLVCYGLMGMLLAVGDAAEQAAPQTLWREAPHAPRPPSRARRG